MVIIVYYLVQLLGDASLYGQHVDLSHLWVHHLPACHHCGRVAGLHLSDHPLLWTSGYQVFVCFIIYHFQPLSLSPFFLTFSQLLLLSQLLTFSTLPHFLLILTSFSTSHLLNSLSLSPNPKLFPSHSHCYHSLGLPLY